DAPEPGPVVHLHSNYFVAHELRFAAQGEEEEDDYNAAQRYDWDDVSPNLMEPRAPHK
ncbi:hypothetical protein FRC11_003839, partial [Ceratobasidium sp. 423]